MSLSRGLADSEYDLQASFFKEVNTLLLRMGMCVHMRTKAAWLLFDISSARGQHPLLKVLHVFHRGWPPASLLFLDKG